MTAEHISAGPMIGEGGYLADPGNAPSPDDAPQAAERKPPATSRVLWFVTYAAVLVFMTLRIPRTYELMRTSMPAEMSASINDKDMEALALRIGVFLGVVLTALIIGILFAVSATLERRVFTARIAVGAKVSFGLYFLVVSLCVLPRQIVGFAFDTPALQGKALLYGYAVVVGLLSPFVFRGTWRDLSAGKIAMVFMTSVGLAALTGIG